MRFYQATTSDTGKSTTTRGGNGWLRTRFTCDVEGGRAEVVVEMVSDSWGKARMTIRPVRLPDGFTFNR